MNNGVVALGLGGGEVDDRPNYMKSGLRKPSERIA